MAASDETPPAKRANKRLMSGLRRNNNLGRRLSDFAVGRLTELDNDGVRRAEWLKTDYLAHVQD